MKHTYRLGNFLNGLFGKMKVFMHYANIRIRCKSSLFLAYYREISLHVIQSKFVVERSAEEFP